MEVPVAYREGAHTASAYKVDVAHVEDAVGNSSLVENRPRFEEGNNIVGADLDHSLLVVVQIQDSH